MRRGNVNNKNNEGVEKTSSIPTSETLDNGTDVIHDKVNIEEQEKVKVETEEEISVSDKKSSNKDKLKVVILIVFAVLAVLITASLLTYKYIESNKDKNEGNTGNIGNTGSINNVVENKGESADSKYLVSFKDMYTINPITIVSKEYKNGSIKVDGETEDKVYIEYVQISGLVDTVLQNKINDEIKNTAFKSSDEITSKQQYRAYTYVQGNFSNILSINIDILVYENNELVNEQDVSLNYNLATGEKIKFLDLFADNTPMNAIIYDVKYESLAWDTEINLDASDEELDKATNMDRRDTSEYEDIILKAMNRYNNLDKDSIEFYVAPSMVYAKLPINEDGEESYYAIKLYKYIDYVTMYKKFETDKVIYENIQAEKLLVFNDMMDFTKRYYKIETDNLFISVFDDLSSDWRLEQEQEYTQKYSKDAVNMKNKLEQKYLDETVANIKKLADKNKTKKGYMARYMVTSDISEYDNGYGEETFITVSMYGTLEEMDIDYYRGNAFRLLAKQNVRPRASIDDLLVGELEYDNKNIKSLEGDDEMPLYSGTLYYDLEGALIATSYDKLQEYLDSKYK